jgi:hypothetical protein
MSPVHLYGAPSSTKSLYRVLLLPS